MQKTFGGAQEGAGRKRKSTSGTQKPISFGAAPDCENLLRGFVASKSKSKGEVICAALRLAELHPDEFNSLLEKSETQ